MKTSSPNARRTVRRKESLLCRRWAVAIAFILPTDVLLSGAVDADNPEPDGLRLSSAYGEVNVGDRLFFETRFAQYFFAHCGGDINAPLEQGDRLVDVVSAVDR